MSVLIKQPHTDVVWGVPKNPLPINDLPEDTLSYKVKYRNKDAAYIFIRSKNGISKYMLRLKADGYAAPHYEIGPRAMNKRNP